MKYKFFLLSFLVFFSLEINTYSEINIDAEHVVLQDHQSGKILYEKNADTKIYPASMTKIMTSIIAFDLIRSGETTLDEMIIIPEKAWRMSQSGYSSMFIMLNDKVSVENLIKGIVIVSGNDACVALAEGLAGSEEAFVDLMNIKAEQIGMINTNFGNSSGINDVNNYSTVRDIALMSRYLIQNYPEFYTYYKETSFTWDRTGGDPITQGNRNPLLYKNIGADGIKTGFLTVEKYSLASSVIKGKRRLNAVGSGFATKNSRSRQSIKLLNWGFRTFDSIEVAKADQTFTNLDIWLGKKETIEVAIKEDIYLTIPKRKKSIIDVFIEYNGPIKAPIKKGDLLGTLYVYVSDELVKKINLYSNENVKQANIFSRLLRSLNFLVWGDV